MRRGTTELDPALPVVLSESRLLEKGRELANVMGEVDRLETALSAHTKRARKEITERLGVANRLAMEIRGQEEYRDQSTLKFDEDPTKARPEPTLAEAAEALTKIAHVVERVQGREYFAEKPEECALCGGEVGEVNDQRSDGKGDKAPGSYEGLCGWICTAGPVEGSDEPCGFMHWLDPDVANKAALDAVVTTTDVITGEPVTIGEPEPFEESIEGSINGDDADEEDPRARCSDCSEVLTATEVCKKLGICEPCMSKAADEAATAGSGDAEEAEAGA